MHLRAHGGGEGQTTGLAFAHVKRRFGEVVFKKLHLDKTVVRDDGEGRVESRLQTFHRTFAGCDVSLQERGVGVLLHLQQVRNLQHAVAISKTLADTLAFGI